MGVLSSPAGWLSHSRVFVYWWSLLSVDQKHSPCRRLSPHLFIPLLTEAALAGISLSGPMLIQHAGLVVATDTL